MQIHFYMCECVHAYIDSDICIYMYITSESWILFFDNSFAPSGRRYNYLSKNLKNIGV